MSILHATAPAVNPEVLAPSWTRYFNALFPDTTFQLQWQTDVARYLFGRRYHVTTAAEVLAHAAAHGSVDCCRLFDFDASDRRAVEKLLPLAPPSAWAAHDNDTWTIGPEA